MPASRRVWPTRPTFQDRPRPILARLTVITIVLALILALGGALRAAQASPARQSDDAHAALFARLEAIADGKQAVIDRWQTDSLDTLRAVAAQDALLARLVATQPPAPDVQSTVTARLDAVATAHPSLLTLFVAGVDGTVAAASDAARTGSSVAGASFFAAGLETAQLHPLVIDGPGAYRLIATVPVIDPDEQTVGLLAAELNLSILATIMQPWPAMGDTIDAYLVSTADRGLLTPSRTVAAPTGTEIVSVGADRAISAQNGSETYFNPNGTRVAGVYRWLPPGIGLIVEAPLDGQAVAQAATPTDTPTTTPAAAPAMTTTASPTASPTVPPTATPTSPPSATPTATPPAGDGADSGDSGSSGDDAGTAGTPFVASATPEGFPTPTVAELTVAEQVFENGRMVWVEPVGLIWVLVASEDDPNQGDWFCYTDTFVDGDAEIDPEIVPPDDLLQPRRGFGKVWRTVPGVREQLGWAVTPEFGFVSPYTYVPGGTLDGDQYTPGPGEHRLNTLYGERLSFFEQDVRGDCLGGTWRLRP